MTEKITAKNLESAWRKLVSNYDRGMPTQEEISRSRTILKRSYEMRDALRDFLGSLDESLLSLENFPHTMETLEFLCRCLSRDDEACDTRDYTDILLGWLEDIPADILRCFRDACNIVGSLVDERDDGMRSERIKFQRQLAHVSSSETEISIPRLTLWVLTLHLCNLEEPDAPVEVQFSQIVLNEPTCDEFEEALHEWGEMFEEIYVSPKTLIEHLGDLYFNGTHVDYDEMFRVPKRKLAYHLTPIVYRMRHRPHSTT